MALVSVVVVHHHGVTLLRDCLASVFAQPYRPIEVIVVDNASVDGSAEMVRVEFPEAKSIGSTGNTGFAGGANMGVGAAHGEYIVLLNDDTVVEKDWLRELLAMIEQPNVAVVTSRVITDGVPEAFYEINGTINYVGYNIMREFSDLSRVFYAGGTSVMFRKRDVPSPFLAEYFLYQEDVYLSWSMRQRGYDVRMAQGSVVKHKGSVTTSHQATSLVTFYQERNRLLNCLLFYEARTLMLLVPYFLVDAFAKIILTILVGRKSFIGVLRSYVWFLSHGNWVLLKRRQLQSSRRVGDKDIMSLMSFKLVDSVSLVARIVNRVSQGYARLVGLNYHE